MNTRLLEPGILFAFIPPEPQLQSELVLLRDEVSQQDDAHLVVDCSRAEIMTSPSIAQMLLLRKLLAERGRRLILCKVHFATKCIFRVVGLDVILEFANDKQEALDWLSRNESASMKP